MPTTSQRCLSTHGGSGYVLGSYWDGDAIVCGLCGTRIQNPPPTGYFEVPRSGFVNRLFGRTDKKPKWPAFILAERP